ncbi:hypothetical protein N8I77_002769 [Diaporthe amygdali]|uniref:Uncharacterized protein n=1 Tax=Phomopsis amygdali TaxID=1214568 RepID=A0AAD9SRK3_PHOAM|nr:hypothetical protein N8I77_002769 [Diaporthe amygdali]
MPHHANWRTRAKDGTMGTVLYLEGFQKADLRKSLQAGRRLDDDITCSNKDCYLKIPDLNCWAQLDWSYLGSLPSGWFSNDEDGRKEAVADIVKGLKSGNGIIQNKPDETVLKMVACMAVAGNETTYKSAIWYNQGADSF